MTSQANRRLFFAIWPDEAIQHRLADVARSLAQQIHGNPVPVYNIHATLAFLGSVADDATAELKRLADDRAAFTCALTLDRVGWFSRGIVFAAPRDPPKELLDLAANLRETLRESGYRNERRLFAPHITLVRNSRQPPASSILRPISWLVRGVHLVQSELRSSGAVYHRVN